MKRFLISKADRGAGEEGGGGGGMQQESLLFRSK